MYNKTERIAIIFYREALPNSDVSKGIFVGNTLGLTISIMKKQLIIRFISFVLIAIICNIQMIQSQDLKDRYKVVNRVISAGPDAGSIRLSEADKTGIAWINGVVFSTGVIEFDIRGKDVLQKSFVGVAFHGVNDTTYDAIYFRPFNFHATDTARKVHSVQYISSPLYDWPKLRAEFPGKYEKEVVPEPDPNDWFHVRIMVATQKISVYVNENTSPALVVEPLRKLNNGQVGYWVGNGSGGDWKNMKITPVTP